MGSFSLTFSACDSIEEDGKMTQTRRHQHLSSRLALERLSLSNSLHLNPVVQAEGKKLVSKVSFIFSACD